MKPFRPLAKLDHRLLLNRPIIWSSRLHYVIYGTGIVFLLNFLVACFIPIEYTSIPDLTWVLFYSCFIAAASFSIWLYTQNLIAYRLFHGVTSRLHSAKTLLISYLILIITLLFAFIPFRYLQKRIVDKLIDPQLPELYSDSYSPEAYFYNPIDTSRWESLSGTKKGVDPILTLQDRVYEYNKIKYGKLSDLEIAWKFFQEAYPESKIISIDSIVKQLTIEYGVRDTSYNTTYKTQKISYEDYKDVKSYSAVYEKMIYKRMIRAIGERPDDNQEIEIYYYLDSGHNYRYFSAATIQLALFSERIEQGVKKQSAFFNEERTEKLITQQVGYIKFIDNGKEGKAFPILLAAIEIFVLLIVLMINYFGLLNFFKSIFLAAVCSMIFFLVFPEFLNMGREDSLMLFVFSIISAFCILKIGNSKKQNKRNVVLLQISVYFLNIWFLLFVLTFQDSSTLLLMLFGICYLFFLPWFIISTFSKFYSLPKS